jgi:hypothetical protein
MRVLPLALSLFLVAGLAAAQTSTEAPAGTAPAGQTPSSQPAPSQVPSSQPAANQPATTPQTPTPEPYEKGEFPGWARDLWRAEVVFVGSFPFSIFFTLEGYDFYKYARNGFVASPTSPAPWPFTSALDLKYTADEQFWLIVSAATVSLMVSAADFLIGRFLESNAKR